MALFNPTRRVFLGSTAALLASCASTPTSVDRVHFLVGFKPGASFDVTSRAAAAALLATRLVQSATVENLKPDGGLIATKRLMDRSVDNSNTLMMLGTSAMARNLKGLFPYKLSDLSLVALFSVEPLTFAVKSSSRFQSIGDVVAALKADPASVRFCSDSDPGLSEHLCAAKMLTKVGIAPKSVTYIPKKNGHNEHIAAVVSREAEVVIAAAADILEYYKDKSVRVLAISGDKRVAGMPDVPALAEAGVPRAFLYNARGFFMAPGTDPAKVIAMSQLLEKMVATPEWEAERVKGEVTMLFSRPPGAQQYLDGWEREARELQAALGISS
jgi:putative tricarboxylic transport membrane protein